MTPFENLLPTDTHDPYQHLEDSTPETLTWVTERSAATLAKYGGADFEARRATADEIFSAKDKLITATKRGEYVYDFYTDGDFPRGLWRRAKFIDYMVYTSPDTEPAWEILLDVGALGESEGESWVFGGARLRYPDYTRALVTLHPGGSDANVIREFDLATKSFISAEDDGFYKPESKGDMQWYGADAVIISTDFGPGSMTESGYPLSSRLWKRGTDLAQASELMRGDVKDVAAGAVYDHTRGYEKLLAYRAVDFHTEQLFLIDPETFEQQKILLPETAQVGSVRDWAVIHLRYDWELDGHTFPAGSLLTVPFTDALSGPVSERVNVLFTPTAASSILSTAEVAAGVVFTVLDNVKTRIYYAAEAGWEISELHPELGEFDVLGVSPVEREESNDLWIMTSGFLTPSMLLHGTVKSGELSMRPLRQAPARFSATDLAVEQRWATSADGTRVPYFVVGDAEVLAGNSPRRTLLSGYGGFEVPRLPSYIATYGKLWLEQGNVYVLANIRGGGEFGPAWHQAALREKRHHAYADFAAVAHDLVDSGITSVPQLACIGGSNGGMLVGNMYTTYPEHFGAIICEVPLLDMKRYNKLLAGASWMDEYGNPDTADWEYLRRYSAYHNVKPGTATSYPPILLTTSTKDDRVHPGHARKFFAMLENLGYRADYYENTEGGHAGAADIKQRALKMALIFTFLDAQLGVNQHEHVD